MRPQIARALELYRRSRHAAGMAPAPLREGRATRSGSTAVSIRDVREGSATESGVLIGRWRKRGRQQGLGPCSSPCPGAGTRQSKLRWGEKWRRGGNAPPGSCWPRRASRRSRMCYRESSPTRQSLMATDRRALHSMWRLTPPPYWAAIAGHAFLPSLYDGVGSRRRRDLPLATIGTARTIMRPRRAAVRRWHDRLR